MSGDSGIYILQTKDGYRVVHTQAIENIYDGDGFDLQAIADYFGPCVNVAKNEIEAYEQAKILYDEIMDDDYCPIIEYRVQFIKGMEDQEFPFEFLRGTMHKEE